MTLKDFIELLAANPFYILAFFILIPVTALIAGILGKNEGHISPWKYLYTALIFLICIPGIFAVTLNIYLFLFEKRSVFESDIYTQVLPIIAMVATLLLIKNNVSLDKIPGFGKLSGLIMMIAGSIIFMWFIDRARIIIFSYLPVQHLLGIFVIVFAVIWFGWTKFMKSPQPKP